MVCSISRDLEDWIICVISWHWHLRFSNCNNVIIFSNYINIIIEKFVYLYNLNNKISYLKLGLFTKLYRLLESRWGGAPRRARLSLMGPYGGRQSLSGGLPSPWEYNDGPHPPKHETWDKAKWWIYLFGCHVACCYIS